MTLSVNPITSVLCVVDISEKFGTSFFTVTKKFTRNISVESEVVSSTLLEKLIIFIISVGRDMLKTVQRICSQGWQRELLDQSEVSQTIIRIQEMYFFFTLSASNCIINNSGGSKKNSRKKRHSLASLLHLLWDLQSQI